MEKRYNFWFVAKPAEDLPGQWVAHCLDLDVVSQGNSLQHAIEMICEAVAMMMADRASGRDKSQTQRAPEEYYDLLFYVLQTGERLNADELLAKPEKTVAVIAGQILVEQRDNHPESRVPAAWEIDAARRNQLNLVMHA